MEDRQSSYSLNSTCFNMDKSIVLTSVLSSFGYLSKLTRDFSMGMFSHTYSREKEFHVKGKEPGTEMALHLWCDFLFDLHCRKDSSLREIVDLLKEQEPSLREWGTRLRFSFVYPDK